MPIKERQLKILLMLFLSSDVSFNYVPLKKDIMKIFDITLNQKTKGTLSSMIRKELIEKKVGYSDEGSINENQNGNGDFSSEYRLTEKGYYALCLEFPTFRFLRDEWDGIWRIISYEIPEAKRHLRDRLRREMKGWGLGPWHRSFWLTAHPVINILRDLVYGKEEEQYIQAFESTHMFGNMEVLVEKVWNKSVLEARYKELFRMWHNVLSGTNPKIEKYRDIVYEYVKVLKDDPGLPSSLVGKKWIGFEAFAIFKEMRGILLSSE